MAEPHWLPGKRAAQALRLELNLGFAPVNVWDVIRDRGVELARHEFGERCGDGFYLWRGGCALITINSSERAARQRFTAAHELGHHELHRFEADDLAIADKDVFDTRGDPREVAANAFGGYLLAPDEALQQDSTGRARKDIVPRDVVELMRKYGLSYEATTNRLNLAGVVNQPNRKRVLEEGEGQIERLVREAGFDEEAIFPFGPDLPAELVDGALALYRDAVISADRLGDILELDPEQAVTVAAERGYARPEDPLYNESVAELLT